MLLSSLIRTWFQFAKTAIAWSWWIMVEFRCGCNLHYESIRFCRVSHKWFWGTIWCIVMYWDFLLLSESVLTVLCFSGLWWLLSCHKGSIHRKLWGNLHDRCSFQCQEEFKFPLPKLKHFWVFSQWWFCHYDFSFFMQDLQFSQYTFFHWVSRLLWHWFSRQRMKHNFYFWHPSLPRPCTCLVTVIPYLTVPSFFKMNYWNQIPFIIFSDLKLFYMCFAWF